MDGEHDEDGGYRGRRVPGGGHVYDGKRSRKPVVRKTIDYHSNIIEHLYQRFYQPTAINTLPPFLPPTVDAAPFLTILHPNAQHHHPQQSTAHGYATKYISQSVNKARTSIICLSFTPDTRRIVTGCASGELTLWNGLTFNFETIVQGHDDAIRCQSWAGGETGYSQTSILATADDSGIVKLWQSSMNNLKAFRAHSSCIRDICWSPHSSCSKLVTCSDDHTVSVWDVVSSTEEHSYTGHGWDVKSIDYHPSLALLASGSKDKLIKLWDTRVHTEQANLIGHKDTINSIQWNRNGHWLASCARDRCLKIWDIRMMSELVNYRGNEKELTVLKWHPCMEELVVSGAYGGDIRYWSLVEDKQEFVAEITAAHDKEINDLLWHPLGHLLISASTDQLIRYWCRNKPGDELTDKYNVKSLPAQDQQEAMMELAQAEKLHPLQHQQQQHAHSLQQQSSSLPLTQHHHSSSFPQQQQQSSSNLGNYSSSSSSSASLPASMIPLGYASEGQQRVAERDRERDQQLDHQQQQAHQQQIRRDLEERQHRESERDHYELQRKDQDRVDRERMERERYQQEVERMRERDRERDRAERDRYDREVAQRQRRDNYPYSGGRR